MYRCPVLAGLLLCGSVALAEHYTLPLFVTPTSTDATSGVVRILNSTAESGTVEIYAIDESGASFGPATFTLGASSSAEFSASDLVSGNAMKGLTGGVGSLSGNVRLEIDTDLQIVPAAYVRAADGTLSAMHDTVRGGAASGGVYEYLVPVFNPSTQMTQASRLRLINPGDVTASVMIEGGDDNGTAATRGTVVLSLAAGSVTTLTAQQLEAGDASLANLTGQLGAGVGKWQLTVSSDQPILVGNVVSSTSGYMNNLSTTAVAGRVPQDHEAFNERFADSGIEYQTDSGNFTFMAEAGDQFTETGEADGVALSFTGSYAYEAIGPDAGRVTVSYDDDRKCEANLYFATHFSGWFSSFCTGTDDPDGYWVGGNWTDVDRGDESDPVIPRYVVDDALPGVPVSGSFVPAAIFGGSISSNTRGTTITLNDGGFFELTDGSHYTCTSADGCAIKNDIVTRGTVEAFRAGVGVVRISDNHADHRAALTAGLPERPFVSTTVGGTEGDTQTVGTLQLGLNPDVFPVIASLGDVRTALVAASRLGEGSVVAFPGQDFLSPGDRATLLGNASADRLLANAVRWAGRTGAAPLRVLVDNQRVADALNAQGIDGVEVVGGGAIVRDWSSDALDGMDVAVVLANDWGTPHMVEASVAPLRAFAHGGGGLVVAASAFHWSYWIEENHGPLPANVLLSDAGITWNEDPFYEIESATTKIDPPLAPFIVWAQYIGGGSLDASQMASLPGLMNSALELGRTGELDIALARLVRETPVLPVSSAAPEARLAAAVGETLDPHEWPDTHPWAAVFPGLPAAHARRTDGTVTVDATWREFSANATRRERHVPLGFYAPPGSPITIEVPPEHASGDLRISVGELYDHLGQAGLAVWERAPGLRRTFPVAGRQTAITNAYGGSIALIVPAHYAGTIPVTVRGAIPMAIHTAGKSNAADWRSALDAGAPQAIIQSPGGIRFVISTESARAIDNPGEVSAFWDGFQRHHAALAAEPVSRAYESIWIFDPQVGYGEANALPLRINYPLFSEAWVLVPGSATGRAWIAQLPNEGPKGHVVPPPGAYSPWMHGVNWWLFGHEFGHQWQTEDWGSPWAGETYPEIGEVAVNLFTMYTLNYYIYGGGDKTLLSSDDSRISTLDHADLAHLRWPTAGDFERLSLYRQLIVEFGWTSIERVFKSYYDPAYPRSKYGGQLDGFAVRFSAIVERDLVGFFQHWEYPLSETSVATIHSFGHEEWLPPGW